MKLKLGVHRSLAGEVNVWTDISQVQSALSKALTEMTTPNKTPPGADPKQLERTGTVREIGSQAVWSLSSCKPGFGVDQLRDDNLETYWQSDGSQPHLVNIQFRRKTTVKTLCIYADYKSDESYTPSKISVRVGNNFHNLQEIRDGCATFIWKNLV
ncbi:anaphase-promoting complex subunit 10 isoform X3 [Geospiza fortis]|uniref:Anaphase-promoting complex subunit 10 n=1 Tax=Geospiza fortis TaxID=48883 RepID=A0A8N5F763_GEOFO|nr:anaphase-promoting complex subunit 10 isoform X3 [Camarhynchus parvulus]XP_030922270.1 anaphase-promoting complex subunit 10 isoform X3 [Geospiza fortis]XP_030922271.1 anaphase-promoting complex subunit 10 isoform X3 [Geospiza fortis]